MEVIARRELAALDRRGERRCVEVRLGKPTPSERQGGEWACPVQVVGLGPERIKEAFGVDSVQAIQLAPLAIDLTEYFREVWEKTASSDYD